MKKFLCYDTEQAARGEINVDSRGMLKPVDSELNEIILLSSTSGSSKKFKITVDDSGAISATEV